MSKSAWILLPVALAASGASAAIYKCQAKDGTALYQNFPCPIDSLGSLPSNSTSAPSAPRDPNQTTPKVERVGAAETNRPVIAQSEPRIGMSIEEVRAIWGEPLSSYSDELVEGRVDIWTYGDTRSVKFDVNGKVTAVQR